MDSNTYYPYATDTSAINASGLEIISMPEDPPRLTPGLVRSLARLIRNGPSCRTTEVVQIDGERHPRALAS